MRKLATFLIIILAAIVIASVYGVGHDQVTYSISPEYYTKWKFIQFNLADTLAAQHMTQPRSAVVMVGVKSAWWIGLCLGIVVAAFALLFRNADTMFATAVQSFGIILLVTAISGVIGWFYGHQVLARRGAGSGVRVPGNVMHQGDFITAGAIHNFSYVGAAVGLLVAIVFLLIKQGRLRRPAIPAGSTDEVA
jgi:hypothetical protein